MAEQAAAFPPEGGAHPFGAGVRLGVTVPETRLHPIYLVIETAKTLRQAIPFLVVTILGGAAWWVNAILFGIVMVVAVAQWHVKKYSVISGVLRLRAGIWNRTVRVVPITRITALDAYRSFTQRLIGVWGLKVQSPGDRNGSAVVLGSLSGRRLDQLRLALEAGHRSQTVDRPGPDHPVNAAAPDPPSPLQRYLAWRRSSSAATPRKGPDVIAVLGTPGMLMAAVTNNSILLILAAALVIWYRFSEYVPSRAAEFMHETVEPRGPVAVLIALIVIAIVSGVVLGALRLNRFTLVRDGDVLRNSRGLLSKQSATIPVRRIQAVRIVEGFWRAPFGFCSLQVEVAGIGRANTSQRMLFPLLRTHRAEAMIRRALPELGWPVGEPRPLPVRMHRRYLTVPLEYGAGFTLLFLLLPGWWRLLAAVPLPAACLLGFLRAREARWQLDEQAVLLRWRRVLSRNTVIAHRTGAQRTEWSSSPWKAKAGVAGFEMHFSSGRRARIRYMVDEDALLLLHAVGRQPIAAAEPDRVGQYR